jgi:hypothetical protein
MYSSVRQVTGFRFVYSRQGIQTKWQESSSPTRRMKISMDENRVAAWDGRIAFLHPFRLRLYTNAALS